MTKRVADIAAELNISEDEVRKIIEKLGVRVGRTASKINDGVAASVIRRAKGEPDPVSSSEPSRGRGRGRASSGPGGAADAPADEAPKTKELEISPSLTVKELAELLHVKVMVVVGALMQNGIFATINDSLDYETAAVIATEFGFEPKEAEQEEDIAADVSDVKELLTEDDPAGLVPRAPVISVIGHVDHGKTKLLDAIRGTDVVAGEHGGITQKIGAYQVEHNGRKITFLDTPGHEAFSAMRARGVKSTDIAILVVAADDGVKPQTIEAIRHARTANVPLVVAINKVDKPEAKPERVKQQLAEQEVFVEGYGGSVPVALVSAIQKMGIGDLLDLVLLAADLEDLKANPDRGAVGSIVESRLDPNLGPVATVLIHSGTLRLRDSVQVGEAFGRVKSMMNHHGERMEAAGPSTPVLLAGLSQVPRAGELLRAAESEREAREMAEKVRDARTRSGRRHEFAIADVTGGDDVQKKELKILVKGDLKGSLEAIKSTLEQLHSDTVQLRVVHMGVGDVTDSDVLLASASKAAIYAFSVRVPTSVVKRSEIENVPLRTFNVIYKLVEDVESRMSELLEPERIETVIGRATVLKLFYQGHGELVAGAKLIEGLAKPGTHIRIFREDNLIGEADMTELRQGPEKVTELPKGTECGMRLKTTVRIKEGDLFEIILVELRARSISKQAAASAE